jgi:PAS domain-containing protein
MGGKKIPRAVEHSSDAHLTFRRRGASSIATRSGWMLAGGKRTRCSARSFAELAPETQPDGAHSTDAGERTACGRRDKSGEVRSEFQLCRKLAKSFPVELSFTPLSLGDARDVARGLARPHGAEACRRRALRESEERFKAFMDHSPAIAFIKDEQGRYIYVNRPFEEQFGTGFAADLGGAHGCGMAPWRNRRPDRWQ